MDQKWTRFVENEFKNFEMFRACLVPIEKRSRHVWSSMKLTFQAYQVPIVTIVPGIPGPYYYRCSLHSPPLYKGDSYEPIKNVRIFYRKKDATIIGGCLIWLRQNDPKETDMSETRGLLLRLIWLRRLNQSLQWYDWDAKLTVHTNMTETPWSKLAQIWLRRPKNFCFRFSILHTWDYDTL